MNIKQKVIIITLAIATAFIWSLSTSPTTSALSKSKFIEILCKDFQGPSTSGGTLADECRKDIRKDNKLSKHWHNKTIKFSDWKDKSANQLRRHIDKGNNGGNNNNDNPDDIGDFIGSGDDCGGVETAIIKCEQDNEGGVKNNAIFGILLLVVNIMTAGVVIAAIGGFVYGAILYTTAEANANQVTKAKETIFNVALGLGLFAAMWAFLQFIIPGGVFS